MKPPTRSIRIDPTTYRLLKVLARRHHRTLLGTMRYAIEYLIKATESL